VRKIRVMSFLAVAGMLLAAGHWWADLVAAAWEAAVRSSFTSIQAEAERRAGPGPADH
jgi:hypothetical protein